MKDALHDAFVEDHQHLMRGLAAIRDALRSARVGEAVELAEALDRQVGPHMEFEERVFYPALEPVLGSKFVAQLYDEHAVGQGAIRELVSLGPDASLGDEKREELAQRVDDTLEHAVSCGTLLSHLDALGSREREDLLNELRKLRASSGKWTDLSHGTDRAGEPRIS
jgi:hypothetical protein